MRTANLVCNINLLNPASTSIDEISIDTSHCFLLNQALNKLKSLSLYIPLLWVQELHSHFSRLRSRNVAPGPKRAKAAEKHHLVSNYSLEWVTCYKSGTEGFNCPQDTHSFSHKYEFKDRHIIIGIVSCFPI